MYLTRLLKLDDETLTTPHFPAIVEVADGQLAVVYAISSDHVVLANPLTGFEKISRETFMEFWTKELLLVTYVPDFGAVGQQTTKLFKQFLPLARPYVKLLVGIGIVSVLIQLFGLAGPLFSQVIIDKVLVNGAGGSIGTFAVQIAKAMGAEVTTVDSTIKEGMLRRIGADHFCDYTKEDFTRNGQTYDVILDMVAQSSYSGCIDSLNPKGRYLMANPRISDMLRSVLTSMFSDNTAIFAFAGEKEEELLALKEMIEEGKIKSVVDKIYSLEQVAEAHRRVETEQRLGIVVISVKQNHKT